LPQLNEAARAALEGPWRVDYHGSYPDHYLVGGQVPGEGDQEHPDEDPLRHEVRRSAVELVPEMLGLLGETHALLLDAADRGEFNTNDETAHRGMSVMVGIERVFREINRRVEKRPRAGGP
jgi:hypothetical protein